MCTTISVEEAINLIEELVLEFNNVIHNVNFVIKLLNVILKNRLMTLYGEYFQHILGVIMGKNVAPILANNYMARLEKLLLENVKRTKK